MLDVTNKTIFLPLFEVVELDGNAGVVSHAMDIRTLAGI